MRNPYISLMCFLLLCWFGVCLGRGFAWGNPAATGEGTHVKKVNDFIDGQRIVFINGYETDTSQNIGFGCFLAITDTGALYIWGRYVSDSVGTLSDFHSPQRISFPSGEFPISAIIGPDFWAATTRTGAVFTWGRNNVGQRGIPGASFSMTPARVNLPTNVVAITLMRLRGVMAFTADGSKYFWGDNSEATLPSAASAVFTPTLYDVTLPFFLKPGTICSRIAFFTACGTDGMMWSFTPSEGTSTNSYVNATIRGLAISAFGNFLAWGEQIDAFGQLGWNSLQTSASASLVLLDSTKLFGVQSANVRLMSVFLVSACLANPNLTTGRNEVYVSGYTPQSVLLNPNAFYKSVTIGPVRVAIERIPMTGNVVRVAACGTAIAILTSSGEVFVWGADNSLSSVLSNAASHDTPRRMDVSGVLAGNSDIKLIAGSYFTVAVTTDNRIYLWGSWRMLTSGKDYEALTVDPVDISAGLPTTGNIVKLTVAANGELYAMGYNSRGELGDGTTTASLYRFVRNTSPFGSSVMDVTYAGSLGVWLSDGSVVWAAFTTSSTIIPKVPAGTAVTGVYSSPIVPYPNSVNGQGGFNGRFFVSTSSGHFWTWQLAGTNNFPVCSSSTDMSSDAALRNITYNGVFQHIVFIAPGIDATLFQTQSGHLFACGAPFSTWEPVPINIPGSRTVAKLEGAGGHWAAKATDNTLWDLKKGTTTWTQVSLEGALLGRDLTIFGVSDTATVVFSRPTINVATTKRAATTNSIVITGKGYGVEQSAVSVKVAGNVDCTVTSLASTAESSTIVCSPQSLSLPIGPLMAVVTIVDEFTDAVQVATIIAAPTVTPSSDLLASNALYFTIKGTGFGNFDPLATDGSNSDVAIQLSRGMCSILLANETHVTCQIVGVFVVGEELYASASASGSSFSTPAKVATIVASSALFASTNEVPVNAPQLRLSGTDFGFSPALIAVHVAGGTVECHVMAVNGSDLTCTLVGLPTTYRGQITASISRAGASTETVTVAVIVGPPRVDQVIGGLISASSTSLKLRGESLGSNNPADVKVSVIVNDTLSGSKRNAQAEFSIPCDITSATSSTLECSLSQALPLFADIYASVTWLGASSGDPSYIGTVVDSPVITSTPESLRAANADRVAISGMNFAPLVEAINVTLSSGHCAIESAKSTEIVCRISGSMTEGYLNATVVSYGGSSPEATVAFVVPAPSIVPSTAPLAAGSTALRISGSNFDARHPASEYNNVLLSLSAGEFACKVTAATTGSVECELDSGSVDTGGTLFARVQSHGGWSESQPVAIITQSEQVLTQPQAIGIGIGVAAAFLLLLALAFVLIIRRLRYNKVMKSLEMTEVPDDMAEMFNIKAADIIILSKLGEGSFGAVYLGKWQKRHVAIKRLTGSMMSSQVNEFFREAALCLSIKPHANVVRMFGMCQEMSNFSLVMEFLPNGSLDGYVQSTLENGGTGLNEAQLYRIVRGIAEGMNALVSQGIIHRDLAARNILLANDLEPKISDFGFSRMVDSAAQGGQTNSTVGPIKWMSPESIGKQTYSEKSDVWAYGVVLYEILTGQDPFAGEDLLHIAVDVRDNGYSILKHWPSMAPEYITNLARMCIQFDPTLRPTFSEICAYLDTYIPKGYQRSMALESNKPAESTRTKPAKVVSSNDTSITSPRPPARQNGYPSGNVTYTSLSGADEDYNYTLPDDKK